MLNVGIERQIFNEILQYLLDNGFLKNFTKSDKKKFIEFSKESPFRKQMIAFLNKNF